MVVVGENFNFGAGGAGDAAQLRACGAAHGFETVVVSLVTEHDKTISSTRIRRLLSRGELEEVREILGRPPSAAGLVVAGDQRGRTLGVPTANIDVEAGKTSPAAASTPPAYSWTTPGTARPSTSATIRPSAARPSNDSRHRRGVPARLQRRHLPAPHPASNFSTSSVTSTVSTPSRSSCPDAPRYRRDGAPRGPGVRRRRSRGFGRTLTARRRGFFAPVACANLARPIFRLR